MNEKMIALFHIERGKRKFHSFSKITECPIWDELFINDDEELIDESGRVLLDVEEFERAFEEGIGVIEIDPHSDTWYADYVYDLSDDELIAMMNPGRGFHYLDEELDEALIQFGFSELEVKLARHFDDFNELLNSHLSMYSYIDNNYDIYEDVVEFENAEKDFDEFQQFVKIGNVLCKN
jgi:hypothetical protein